MRLFICLLTFACNVCVRGGGCQSKIITLNEEEENDQEEEEIIKKKTISAISENSFQVFPDSSQNFHEICLSSNR